ncbi:synembryn [Coccinella septempunctata]|uniref:synembryn n=1 Tax=Coccinella septempunctata TaxID=41139 RepID=UPI001D07BCE7|nr:synembryn [Coccinella septempunctata]
MELKDIRSIIEQDEYYREALQSFITKTEKTFTFPALDENNLRADLWKSLYAIANTTSDEQIQANCCSALRILSREKSCLNQFLREIDWLNLLKRFSGLHDINREFTERSKILALEAQKCLCNLVFNSNKAAQECIENDILYNTNERIRLYSNSSYPEEMRFFDIKLLFIITAVRPEARKILREQKNAVQNLMAYLEYILMGHKILKEEPAQMVCEILKALFNLTVLLQANGEDKEQYIKLMQMLRNYLLLPIESKEQSSALHNHVVHLLTNIPNIFYTELIPPLSSVQDETDITHLEFHGHDVSALAVILELLRVKLAVDCPVCQQLEIISPTATVLYKGACSNRLIRKYLRFEILPPLKDVYSRPEEGTALRNCLCRLLTTPVTHLRDIIAEFLFVLCKKNVKRMVKYTGYGNAAGLLAQRGLLGGREDEEAAEFSSDNEDSETEEYAENKHNINPVLGCYEPSHPDAMAGMTDEQKEYEAMKIINLMDALTREGTIKPCKIDENGKPVPIEHVLELQDSFKKKERFNKTKE